MQNIAIFDIVVVSITILLGLKGLLRGLIKEVFGLLSIVGGIFIASRVAADVGKAIAPILGLENSATIKLIGFIISLIAVWAVIYLLGIIISKIFSVSGLGLFDRIFGFIFGCAKIFFILSIITYALYQVQSFKDLLNKKFSNAVVFPLLVETGGFIVKLDSKDFMLNNNKKKKDNVDMEDPDIENKESLIDDIKKTVKEVKDTTVKSGSEVIDVVKKTVNKNIDEASKKLKENSDAAIDEATSTNEKSESNEEKGN